MNLGSARGLKAKLVGDLVRPLQIPIHSMTRGGRREIMGKRVVPAGYEGFDLPMAAQPIGGIGSVQRSFALGLAPAKRGGFRLAIRVQRPSMLEHPLIGLITQEAKGEVDVRVVGKVMKRAPWYQSRRRPIGIGCSIGHVDVTAGTIGAFVVDRISGKMQILSNNHVLANEDRADVGDSIIQCGRYDGGRSTQDDVGTLTRMVPLVPGTANLVDAAIAEITDDTEVEPFGILDSNGSNAGRLNGVRLELAHSGTPVQKVGRTTGFTSGQITAFEVDGIVVGYDKGNISFDNQIEIESTGRRAFSDGGDSGSLILDGDFNAVGLLFAGSDAGGSNNLGLTYANPINTVLSELDVVL